MAIANISTSLAIMKKKEVNQILIINARADPGSFEREDRNIHYAKNMRGDQRYTKQKMSYFNKVTIETYGSDALQTPKSETCIKCHVR